MPTDPENIPKIQEKLAELKKTDPQKYLALLTSLNSMLTETADEIDSLIEKKTQSQS